MENTTISQPESGWLVGAVYKERSQPFPQQTVFAADAATYRKRMRGQMLTWVHATLTRYPRCARNEAWVRLQGIAEVLLGRPLYLDETGLMAEVARSLYAVWEREDDQTPTQDPTALRRQIEASLQVNRVYARMETVLSVETIAELRQMLDEHQEGSHRVSPERMGHYLAVVLFSHERLRELVTRDEMGVVA